MHPFSYRYIIDPLPDLIKSVHFSVRPKCWWIHVLKNYRKSVEPPGVKTNNYPSPKATQT